MPPCKNIRVPKIQPRCATESFAQGAGTYELLNKLLGKSPHFVFYFPNSLETLTAQQTKCYYVRNVLHTALQPQYSQTSHFHVSILVLSKQTWIRSTIRYNNRYLEALNTTAFASRPVGLRIVATEGSPRLTGLMCSLQHSTQTENFVQKKCSQGTDSRLGEYDC